MDEGVWIIPVMDRVDPSIQLEEFPKSQPGRLVLVDTVFGQIILEYVLAPATWL
jgi:hypothetical protein